MPTQRTINIYKFEELSPKAKAHAIEKWQQMEHENFDSDRITEMFQFRLEELGLPTKNINWSLSNSQGDGVAFYGHLSLDEYVKKNRLVTKYKSIAPLFMDTNVEIEHRRVGNYHHYNTMSVEMNASDDANPEQKKLFKDLYDHIVDHIKDVSRELEKDGYKEIDYLTSEEQAKESFEANETEFLENGDRPRV